MLVIVSLIAVVCCVLMVVFMRYGGREKRGNQGKGETDKSELQKTRS